MLNWQKPKNRIFTKVISLLILQAFLCANIGYAAPSDRSMFKNKRPNYKAIQERRESALQEKKDSLSEKQKPKKSSYKKDSNRRIKTISLKDLSSIYIPEELGRVTEVYQAEEGQEHGAMPLVVHIQDLHTNPEGQLNLASILEVLITDYGLNLVCSEGAEGEVDTSSVSSFPDYEVREKTARLFINSGELTGEEYLSITKYPDLPIWGIEDKDIYFKNIIEFNKIMRLSSETQVFTRQVKEALERLKPRMYTKELLEIDAKEREYEEDKIEMNEYIDYLLGLGEVWREQVFASSKYKNIALFKETFSLEKDVNQDKVIKESQGLLLKLKEVLDERGDRSEREKLFTKASLFKDQKISPFSFYSYMDTLAQRYLRDYLGRYPNLFAFVVYLEKINSLDSVQLFQEIEELTYEAKDFLSVSENQKLLTRSIRHIKFIEDFFNIKVSNEELDYYLANKEEHAVSFFKTFLDHSLKKYSINSFVDFNEDLIDGNLPELEHFYEIAKKRDIAMFNNTIREIEKRKTKIAALIMGGFHTRGVTQLLKEKGYSYVVIAPYSSTEIDEENYRYLLSGKRKPLSDLIDELNELLRPPLLLSNEKFKKAYDKKMAENINEGNPAHFSLLSKYNGLTVEEATTEVFSIGGEVYNVKEGRTSIDRLPVLESIKPEGFETTFTIRGSSKKEWIVEFLNKNPHILVNALNRSKSFHEGKLGQDITIVLADKYDYLAGDHKENNIVILNASDIEDIFRDKEEPIFISEFVTSLLSEEFAHERGAGGDRETEKSLAWFCADEASEFLKSTLILSDYIDFIKRHGKDIKTEDGYLRYLEAQVSTRKEKFRDRDKTDLATHQAEELIEIVSSIEVVPSGKLIAHLANKASSTLKKFYSAGDSETRGVIMEALKKEISEKKALAEALPEVNLSATFPLNGVLYEIEEIKRMHDGIEAANKIIDSLKLDQLEPDQANRAGKRLAELTLKSPELDRLEIDFATTALAVYIVTRLLNQYPSDFSVKTEYLDKILAVFATENINNDRDTDTSFVTIIDAIIKKMQSDKIQPDLFNRLDRTLKTVLRTVYREIPVVDEQRSTHEEYIKRLERGYRIFKQIKETSGMIKNKYLQENLKPYLRADESSTTIVGLRSDFVGEFILMPWELLRKDLLGDEELEAMMLREIIRAEIGSGNIVSRIERIQGSDRRQDPEIGEIELELDKLLLERLMECGRDPMVYVNFLEKKSEKLRKYLEDTKDLRKRSADFPVEDRVRRLKQFLSREDSLASNESIADIKTKKEEITVLLKRRLSKEDMEELGKEGMVIIANELYKDMVSLEKEKGGYIKALKALVKDPGRLYEKKILFRTLYEFVFNDERGKFLPAYNLFNAIGKEYEKSAIEWFDTLIKIEQDMSALDKLNYNAFTILPNITRLVEFFGVIRTYSEDLDKKEILDIGAGYGLFLHILDGLGFKASGLELRKWYVRFGKEAGRLEITQGDIASEDMAIHKEFGVTTSVFMLDYIEREDILTAISNISNLTKDGGVSVHFMSQHTYDRFASVFENNAKDLDLYIIDGLLFNEGVVVVFQKRTEELEPKNFISTKVADFLILGKKAPERIFSDALLKEEVLSSLQRSLGSAGKVRDNI